MESIPIAATGQIKVISIDYRQGPEYTFPAASEDVAAVYRELIKTYKPQNIGIYGCSAGGWLTAQAVAWFQQHNLPCPGAVGILCAGAPIAMDSTRYQWTQSDSARIIHALFGLFGGNYQAVYGSGHAYWQGVDRNNRLASPGSYDDVMREFPPSLLITGSRDYLASSVFNTHAQLTRLGVEADLHVWEGMPHAFFYGPTLPESREAYAVIVRFFEKHLGQ